jgi:F0F1-type ATP synthase assembly protein I
MSGNRERRPDYRGWSVLAKLATVGMTLAFSVGIGIGIGLLLDRWLKTNWWVIVFTLVGVAAGFKQLIQAVIQAGREQEELDAEQRREERGPGPERD